MGPPPWTLKTEKTWLINYIKGNFEKKGGLAGLKEDALGEFLMAFPKEKRASETEDEMVKRYELLPRVRVYHLITISRSKVATEAYQQVD